MYCTVLPTTHDRLQASRILAATGEYVEYSTGTQFDDLPPVVAQRFQKVLDAKAPLQFDVACVIYNAGNREARNLLYVAHASILEKLDRQLLEIYTQSVAVTSENINLQDDLRETQKEPVYILADAVGTRSKKTGAHVKRVALDSEMLARLCGLSKDQILLIKHASPLHEIC